MTDQQKDCQKSGGLLVIAMALAPEAIQPPKLREAPSRFHVKH
jgi:hypothetical protein